MLIIIRWILKVFKKEHDLLARYERSHPHFLRYVGIDAVLSVVLIFAGFHFVVDDSRAKELVHSGAVLMSSEELVSHIQKEHVDAYWLGAAFGYRYTLNHEILGVVDIFYWPEATGNSDAKHFLYEIKTYKSQKIWDAHTHPILAIANTTTIAVKRGLSIRINRSSMKGVIATFANKREILAIAYPVPQPLESMIKNVESLTLVR